MQQVNSARVGRIFAAPKKTTDMVDIFGIGQFSGTVPFYYKEVSSNSSITPPSSGYEGRAYKFQFDGGVIYDNMRLLINWGAFTDAGGADGIRQTQPIERCEYRVGGVLISTVRDFDYDTQFKLLSTKEQAILRNGYNYTITATGNRPAVQQELPLITMRGALTSRDIKSSSTSIPIPNKMGLLEVTIYLKNQFTIGGASVDPTLDAIEMFADMRVYPNEKDQIRTMKEVITSPIPFLVHDTIEIAPIINESSDASGQFALLEFNIGALTETNVQYYVLKAFLTGDTEGMSTERINWDSAGSGIYEKGAITKVIRTASGVRVAMFNSGNGVDSGTDQWSDGDLIISANVAPVTEIEKWVPDYFQPNTNPRLRLQTLSGFAASTAYDFRLYAVILNGWSMSNGSSM